MPANQNQLSLAVRKIARPLTEAASDYDPLLDAIGESPVVLLGEASHGTHEFYRTRARITERLIRERGFVAIAVEADWPDAYRVNRSVRGASDDVAAGEALREFERFPVWMWRNADVLDFVGWLREHNDALPPGERVGFYGLDLYSLHRSIRSVLAYLDKVDPEAARRARYRYSCFEDFGEEPQAYGYAASFDLSKTCEREVVAQLTEIQRRAAEYARRDGRIAADEFFFAEQNARLVKNAEEYYRAMFQGRISSWNLRDRHMAETLGALRAHLGRQTGSGKVVVWEHNSHIGDARATEMAGQCELNVGQLAREQYGSGAVLIGFTTHGGTVTAASEWGGAAERNRVRPALPNSYERVFHDAAVESFLIVFRGNAEASDVLAEPLLERAIGVIYRPESERASHYFRARLPKQFDAVVHFDQTRAVEPLERAATWDRGEVPETYPTGV